MAEEEIELSDEAPKSSKKNIIVFGLVGLLLLGGGIGGTLFFLGGESTDAGVDVEAEAEVEKEVERKEAIYISLKPSFTVNFQSGGGARFLQIDLQAMTRDEDVLKQVHLHMPVIRDALVMLFSSKTSKELSNREGKQKLQADTLAAIQEILERETGSTGVEQVYFTSFVMQ